jgi:uncharacterized caspase-like protein
VKGRSAGIGLAEIRINGVEVQGRADPPTGGMYSQRLPLPVGRSVITARVYNADNTLASRQVRAVVEVTAMPTAEQPTLHLMTVGVTQYRDAALKAGVKYAAADARAMADTLGDQRRAATGRVAPPVVLIDQEATKERIIRELKAMAGRIKRNDLFVLHLAGHGVSLDDGEYYFMPVEVIFREEADLKRQGLSGPELNALLKTIPANKTVVLLDTCSSGSFLGSGGRGRSLGGEKWSISRFAKMSGRVVLAAAGNQDMALESEDNQRGIFTGVIIRGLLGKANRNGDSTVEVGELANYVEEEVPRITRERLRYEQYPMRSIQGRNFPLSRTTP